MDITLDAKLTSALWVSHSLFERGKTSGASANMSFKHGDTIYITTSGSCFGTMGPADFIPINENGTPCGDGNPSKEWPLHMALYKKSQVIGAVIHTHSLYSILWSLVPTKFEHNCIPDNTPYLKMKLGTVGLIPYEKPGSKALFSAFQERLELSDGFILKRHGPVVPGKTVMEAFYCLEELEESARIAWELYRAGLAPCEETVGVK